MKSSFHSLIPFLPLFCNCQLNSISHHGRLASRNSTRLPLLKVKVTLRLTVGQSVSLGIEPHLGPMTRYLLLSDSYGLVYVCRTQSREYSRVFCIHYSGACERRLIRVRVPWYSRPYVTVSDLRLPFSSPPTTRRVTVEVFDPASTRATAQYISKTCRADHLSLLPFPEVRPPAAAVKRESDVSTSYSRHVVLGKHFHKYHTLFMALV
jgi:hypothetical protein